MNNQLLNNNGANTNRGAVVIPRTTRETATVTGFTGFTMSMHAKTTKTLLRKALYNWAPVFPMVTILGMNQDGSLRAVVEYTVGGNSPVARAFVAKNSTVRTIDVVQIDKYGKETFRKVTVGVDGDTRYDYTNDLTLARFNLDTRTEKSTAVAEAIVNRILSEGLTIREDKTVAFGKEEGLYINPLIWTPSNERSAQMLMTSMDSNMAWNKLERIGGGTISRRLSGEMSAKNFKKLASRMGLFATPAVEVCSVGNDKFGMLVVNQELLGESDFNSEVTESLSKLGIAIDSNQWDGAAYFSAEYAMESLKSLGMKRVDIARALMFAFQLRITGVYAKIFGESLHQSVMNRMASNIINNLKDVKVDGQPIFKVVGNPDNIAMILDSNAAKLIDMDNLKEETVYLLDIAKSSVSATSTQLTDKYAVANKEATKKCLKDKTVSETIEFANGVGDATQSLLDDNINVWQMLINLAKNNPESSLFVNVFSDMHIFKKIIKEVSTKQEAAYRKGRVAIDSLFQRALFDATYLITNGAIASLLGTDSTGAIECYSTDVLEKYASEIAEIEADDSLSKEQKDSKLNKLLSANIIKYPTPGAEEIERVVFKTERQMRDTAIKYVNDGVIDIETAKLLLNYFQFTSYGVIKIAADNALKHKLAGMDTDYDGVVVIFEKELVEIMEQANSIKTAELKANNAIEATTTYGGVIPFIDHNKTAENFFKQDSSASTSNSVTNNTAGIDIFNRLK